MKTILEDYDIYPKIFRTRRKGRIHIKPMGAHAEFSGSISYRVAIVPMHEIHNNEPEHPYPSCTFSLENGIIRVDYTFGGEGQYTLLINYSDKDFWGTPQDHELNIRLYAVDEDLFALRPYRGDMHCHTIRSDGREGPAIVAANYRKAGFDFLSITDHGQYEPSIEAINAFKDVPIDFRLFPGEEVHPPQNNSHYVHFAGVSSVNALFRADPEKYHAEVNAIKEKLNLPEFINAAEYASALWVIEQIHKAGGMAIMAHPCWIQDNAYHIKESMYSYMLDTFPFDALELSCGQSREENQMQISFWQQKRADGHSVNIVGSSDSHGTVNSTWFNLSKMVILAESCDKDPLIAGVKSGRTVVLEQYAGEELPRLYGIHRYVSYVLFLLDEYFPLHDALCHEEGRLMRDHACGDRAAKDILGFIQGRCAALQKKCWGE
ncbi:MAG: hypothetical protein LBT14_03015 [Treponema sp.]|nr:hypothetical protein [Treponema sp.]